MTQYLLAVYNDPERNLSEEEFGQTYIDVNVVADELTALGGLIFGGGLNRAAPTAVVRSVDGKVVATDGPFAESKEQLGGFWVIDVASFDDAREWGLKLSAASRSPIEVAVFESEDASVDELFGHIV
jgi:hypothetical protein